MSKIELKPTDVFVYGAAWTALTGGIGAMIGRYWDSRSHFRKQRDELKEFLGQWLQEIERIQKGHTDGTWAVYFKREKVFAGHVAKLQSKFWRKRKFAEMCAPLRQRLPHHFNHYQDDCRDEIAIPIRRLIEWL